MGGTWDLFKYPGIRSDSDMTTFGYQFNPWMEPDTVSHGPRILNYIKSTAEKFGIDRYIRYNENVSHAGWNSEESRYTVTVKHTGTETPIIKVYSASFLFICAGYYDYESPHLPADFTSLNLSSFKGKVIHPQTWDINYDYTDKEVLLVGSGATAITLAPCLVKPVDAAAGYNIPGASSFKHYAKHVTMLQRSPTYVISLPSTDPVNVAIRNCKYMPTCVQNLLVFWRVYWGGWSAFFGAQREPAIAKKCLIQQCDNLLNDGAEAAGRPIIDITRHFTPRYFPWQQRMGVTIDDQFFIAVKSEKLSIKTDTIKQFVETGVELTSGDVIYTDVIITATGLNLKLCGGIMFSVDGVPFDFAQSWLYRDSMMTGLPNAMMCIPTGYYYASATLKYELICRHFCRILQYMDRWGLKQCQAVNQQSEGMETSQILIFESTFVDRSKHLVPKGGDHGPWLRLTLYLYDYFTMLFRSVATKYMHFK